MKILISAVGSRDPFPKNRETNKYNDDDPASIITGCLQIKPDIAYLLHTKGTEANALETKDYIENVYSELNGLKTQIKLLTIDINPVDYL